jgi:hypothetical protein
MRVLIGLVLMTFSDVRMGLRGFEDFSRFQQWIGAEVRQWNTRSGA